MPSFNCGHHVAHKHFAYEAFRSVIEELPLNNAHHDPANCLVMRRRCLKPPCMARSAKVAEVVGPCFSAPESICPAKSILKLWWKSHKMTTALTMGDVNVPNPMTDCRQEGFPRLRAASHNRGHSGILSPDGSSRNTVRHTTCQQRKRSQWGGFVQTREANWLSSEIQECC